MTLQEIKQAIADDLEVYWTSKAYQVILGSRGQYLIKCLHNNHCIGLTWMDGVTLNGNEDEFFIGE